MEERGEKKFTRVYKSKGGGDTDPHKIFLILRKVLVVEYGTTKMYTLHLIFNVFVNKFSVLLMYLPLSMCKFSLTSF